MDNNIMFYPAVGKKIMLGAIGKTRFDLTTAPTAVQRWTEKGKTMREKLIELLSVPTCPSAICNFCRHFKDSYGCEKQKKEQLADHLIAHGVTIEMGEIDFDYEAEE